MSDKIELYVSTVSSNADIKKQQQRITMVLDGKKIEYVVHDISSDADAKANMREWSGNPTALPPQIFRGQTYLGDYTKFDEAIEEERLEEFLKI